MFRWFKKDPPWEQVYAERLYEVLAVPDDLGEVSPERLRIPLTSYRRYADKAVAQREIMTFVALMSAAGPDTRPRLQPVMRAFEKLLQTKISNRGAQIDVEQFAESSIHDVEAMHRDPFSWAQRWLAEFREDPDDNFMVALFADHCLKQFQAFKSAIEQTYRQ